MRYLTVPSVAKGLTHSVGLVGYIYVREDFVTILASFATLLSRTVALI